MNDKGVLISGSTFRT